VLADVKQKPASLAASVGAPPEEDPDEDPEDEPDEDPDDEPDEDPDDEPEDEPDDEPEEDPDDEPDPPSAGLFVLTVQAAVFAVPAARASSVAVPESAHIFFVEIIVILLVSDPTPSVASARGAARLDRRDDGVLDLAHRDQAVASLVGERRVERGPRRVEAGDRVVHVRLTVTRASHAERLPVGALVRGRRLDADRSDESDGETEGDGLPGIHGVLLDDER
jgi:hypothetical protein